jgi:hypothetical protein
VPSAKRQGLVDRFQKDDEVRVFLANIIAGGVGLTLTAATQVVFNDLDWVPANHWQAEDRAYRIGQTRTVNVTYLVGEQTIDEFVQAVLEVKTALVRTIVEGEALTGDVEGNVLDELERALATLSPGLADAPRGIEDEVLIDDLVRAASEQWRSSHPSGTAADTSVADPASARTLRAALEALARVLAGPTAQRFRIASSSKPGSHYTIDTAGGDVTCSCPGFEYRGQCRHARDVKAALASGVAPSTDYLAVD